MKMPHTIDNKRYFTKPNGEEVVDLTQQRYFPGENQQIYDIIIISSDFAMRPDLVARLAYQDLASTDLVLKSNGVSNPFSVDEYDTFFLQEKRSITSQFANTQGLAARDIVRNQYIDPSKAPTKDDNLKKFEARNKPKKGKKKDAPALPPNFANFGDQEIKLKGGKVIFGEDVTANKEVCEENPLSKSEFLKRLAKNRLNKQS